MKRRDLLRLSGLSTGGIIIPSAIHRLESPGLNSELNVPNVNVHNTAVPEFKRHLIAAAPFVYTVKVDIGSIWVAGTVRIGFWKYQRPSEEQVGDFFAYFGGPAIGGANTWGTAWFNYDVKSIAGWEARIQANMAAVAVNVNFWRMHGEVIGNIAAGGIGLMAGVVGGQGKFR